MAKNPDGAVLNDGIATFVKRFSLRNAGDSRVRFGGSRITAEAHSRGIDELQQFALSHMPVIFCWSLS
jgi:hypothetical protein